MSQEEIALRIHRALHGLYDEVGYLIQQKAHEDGLTAQAIVPRLGSEFSEWTVRAFHNREGFGTDPKRDINDDVVIPDIIIHRPGPDGPNLVAIEVKGWWNNEPRKEDEDKLRRIQAKYYYQFLYRIELGKTSLELIEVLPN